MSKKLLALLCILPMLTFCTPNNPDPIDNPDDPQDQPVDPDPEDEIVIPDEIVNGSTILVTNEVIEDFITNVTYPEHDYSETKIAGKKYKDYSVSPAQFDNPPQFSIRWTDKDVAFGEEAIAVVTEEGSGKVFEFTPTDSDSKFVIVTNLLPNAKYSYVLKAAESGKEIKKGSFSTKGHLHHLNFKAKVRNCRDLGGWKTKDGKVVKYRMVYRGGRLETRSSTLTGKGVKQVKAEGIKAQLDLRGQSDVLSAPADPYLDFCAPVIEEGYTQFLRDDKPKMKQCFEYVVKCLREDKPVYYHCSLGRDRTGTLTMVLLGVLGVDEGEISKEYELTQFAPYGYSVSSGEKTQMTRRADYKSAATYIWDNYAKGGSFAQGMEAYLLDIGVAQKDIDDFRSMMLTN